VGVIRGTNYRHYRHCVKFLVVKTAVGINPDEQPRWG
jgi:hypothetical protein